MADRRLWRRTHQASDALREPLRVVAQGIDRAYEVIDLPAARDYAALLDQVIRQIAGDALRGLRLEVHEASSCVDDPMGGDIAEDPREIFLGVPARIAHDELDRLRKLSIAAHDD